jgi:PEP-CTERM motif
MKRYIVHLQRSRIIFACFAIGVVIPSSSSADYISQDSATTFRHSGIVTSTGVVWDTTFANMVSNAIGTNYNEIAFAFMQCYGGGMIDELLSKNLSYASYTSASQFNECAFGFPVGPRLLSQSTYGFAYATALGGNVNPTLQSAAVSARNADIFGPVVNLGPTLFPKGLTLPGGLVINPVLEHPQYTSSGPIGDNITLHQPNPMNPTKNTNYLTVLFGGSTVQPDNTNSLATITNTLNTRGYTLNQVQSIPPGGTAAQLQAAWTNVGTLTNPTTQIFYWNGPGHGTQAFDWIGYLIKNLIGFTMPVKGDSYSFTMPSDSITGLLAQASYIRAIGDTNPLDVPYLEIQTGHQISNVSVSLNGFKLTSFDPSAGFNLLGNGTEYDYRFDLTSNVLQSLSTTEMVTLNWTGADNPSFIMGDINYGDNVPFVVPVVPEPGSCVLLLIGLSFVGVSWLYRNLGGL